MANRNYFKRGAHYNVICDSCGFKFKNDEVRFRWDGFMVCEPCWTPRQPQDLIRARTEDLRLPFVRPRLPDVFVQFYTASLSDSLTLSDAMGAARSAQLTDTLDINDNITTRYFTSAAINGFVMNSRTMG